LVSLLEEMKAETVGRIVTVKGHATEDMLK